MVGGGKLFDKHKLVRRDTSHVGGTSFAINISTFWEAATALGGTKKGLCIRGSEKLNIQQFIGA